jgi:hypothetical protein
VQRLILVVLLSLAAALLVSAPGGAQNPTLTRGFTERVTATSTPKRDRTRPYTFTTRGRIVPPSRYCTPAAPPTRGAGNCIPVSCPAGATDPAYCLRPGISVICSGVVNVRYQKRTTTISSRNVHVRPDCTYQSRVRFRILVPTRRGSLRVRARFQGNPVLEPRNSPTSTVRAG